MFRDCRCLQCGRTSGQCSEGPLNQFVPREKYEAIVVDDGSTDSTPEIAARYEVVVLTQPHQGAGQARKLGVHQASGEIILFTDADRVPASNSLEALLSPFINHQIAGAKGTYRTRQPTLLARFVQIEYEEKYDKMKRECYIDFVDTYSAAYRNEVPSGRKASTPLLLATEDVDLSYKV